LIEYNEYSEDAGYVEDELDMRKGMDQICVLGTCLIIFIIGILVTFTVILILTLILAKRTPLTFMIIIVILILFLGIQLYLGTRMDIYYPRSNSFFWVYLFSINCSIGALISSLIPTSRDFLCGRINNVQIKFLKI